MLAHASPYAVVLHGVQREGQALPPDGAAGADRLGLRDLIKGGTRRGDREEQFGSACRHAASCGQSGSGVVIVWSPGGLGGVVICGCDR